MEASNLTTTAKMPLLQNDIMAKTGHTRPKRRGIDEMRCSVLAIVSFISAPTPPKIAVTLRHLKNSLGSSDLSNTLNTPLAPPVTKPLLNAARLQIAAPSAAGVARAHRNSKFSKMYRSPCSVDTTTCLHTVAPWHYSSWWSMATCANNRLRTLHEVLQTQAIHCARQRDASLATARDGICCSLRKTVCLTHVPCRSQRPGRLP